MKAKVLKQRERKYFGIVAILLGLFMVAKNANYKKLN